MDLIVFLDGAFQEFVDKDAEADNEDDVKGKVFLAMPRAYHADAGEVWGRIAMLFAYSAQFRMHVLQYLYQLILASCQFASAKTFNLILYLSPSSSRTCRLAG
jgi:hypothetical protein